MSGTLQKYIDIAEFIADSVAKTYEIVVFDMSGDEITVAGHYNHTRGTLRPLKALVSEALKSEAVKKSGKTINRMFASEMSKLIKCSIMLIKEDEKTVGALCINVHCQPYMMIEDIVADLLGINTGDMNLPDYNVGRNKKYEEPNLGIIEKVIAEAGVEPGRLSVNERLDILIDLFDLGVFDIKGSVARTAELLEVSEKTIYRNVSEIRKARN